MSKIQILTLPKFNELPDMGLYLKQVVEYLNKCLSPLQDVKITTSMVSNYVKHKLIKAPTNRLYDRDQIALLLFIAIAKNVMDQDDLREAIKIQQETYDTQIAYDYFVKELNNALNYIFNSQDKLKKVGSENTKQKQMLRNIIMAFAYKEYLYQFFRNID